VGGDLVQAPRSKLGEGYRCIAGYYDPLMARRLRKLAAPYDVVHLHRFGEWGTAALHAGKPTVYSAYDYWALGPCQNLYPYPCKWDCVGCYQPQGRSLPRWAKWPLLGRRKRLRRHLRRLDAMVVLSRDAAFRFVGLGRGPDRIHIIPLPVFIEPVDVPRKPDQVLYLGWLSPNKGADVVLRAWPKVREQWPRAVLILAGPQPNEAYARQCALLAGAGISFRGEVSRPEAVRLLCESACVVVPEAWPNPQPLVLCEALAVGTPVVASAIGGIPEHGGNETHYVYHNDPRDWAEKIGYALVRRILSLPRRLDPAQTKAQLEEVYQCVSHLP